MRNVFACHDQAVKQFLAVQQHLNFMFVLLVAFSTPFHLLEINLTKVQQNSSAAVTPNSTWQAASRKECKHGQELVVLLREMSKTQEEHQTALFYPKKFLQTYEINSLITLPNSFLLQFVYLLVVFEKCWLTRKKLQNHCSKRGEST